jgi:hypothetical protein
MGKVYLDDVCLDDESPYYIQWDGTDLGNIPAREPTVTQTVRGKYTVYPMDESVGERTGKVVIAAQSIDHLEKLAIESTLKALLKGSKKLHVGGRYLNAFFKNAKQSDGEVKTAPRLVVVEAEFTAYDPFWYLNQPISGIITPVNSGVEYSLYDDNTLPTVIPDYIFTANTFTMTNWGNAFTFGAGTVTDGPAGDGVNPTIWLKGEGDYRAGVILSAGGDGTFLATDEFRLDPGTNSIRIENEDGTLATVGGTFSINFGNTYMRYE